MILIGRPSEQPETIGLPRERAQIADAAGTSKAHISGDIAAIQQAAKAQIVGRRHASQRTWFLAS